MSFNIICLLPGLGGGVSSGPQRGALFEIPQLAQLWQWKRENHSRELRGLVLISRSGRWPPLLFQDLKLPEAPSLGMETRGWDLAFASTTLPF